LKTVFVDGPACIALILGVYFVGKILLPEYIKVFKGIKAKRASQVRIDAESDQ